LYRRRRDIRPDSCTLPDLRIKAVRGIRLCMVQLNAIDKQINVILQMMEYV